MGNSYTSYHSKQSLGTKQPLVVTKPPLVVTKQPLVNKHPLVTK